MNKEKILGFDVSTYNSDELIEKIFEDYQNEKKLFIVNINPEIIMENYKNNDTINKLNQQKYQIPDGAGIVWASKKIKGNIKERITGIDLMKKICNESQKYRSKIFLYGSKDDTAEKAKKELEEEYPSINIVGTLNGYEDENTVLNVLKKTEIDILFVGLGSPRQEEFIIKHKDELNIKIIMPVGGAFDVISKNKKRAPQWMIKWNIEWLYRLIQEPKRIFRQIKLVKFIYLVKREKVNGKN